MSSDRPSSRPLKPSLAANRGGRAPLTPRLAANATPPTARAAGSRPASTVRSEPLTPRVKGVSTPGNDALADDGGTARLSARRSRVDSLSNGNSPAVSTPTTSKANSTVSSSRNGNAGGAGSAGVQRANRPRSLVSGSGNETRPQAPVVRSPGYFDLGARAPDTTIDSRFFHASDAARQEPAPSKAEVKKAATFFYADGQQEERNNGTANPISPVLSAVSEKRSSRPLTRGDMTANPTRSPPLMSPTLSAISSVSPFFGIDTAQARKERSPSPSKENIHLSYRKGASQIIGTRPSPAPRSIAPVPEPPHMPGAHEAKSGPLETPASKVTPHRRSPSLSSVDSGNSPPGRRRSATAAEIASTPSPLGQEVKSATYPRSPKNLSDLPTIDTSLSPANTNSPPPEATLSPTKGSISTLAAEARRERKVLDLEISNSSLLAINASLEREVRRQKAELKRFRRLSRAGRFSLAPGERIAWPSDGVLSAVGEEDEEGDELTALFGPSSGLSLTEMYADEYSSSDEESFASSSAAEALSPSSRARREGARLAKDERRLQLDLEKHKELLVQSQMMNQSLKRCTYATEDMIREGRRALEYRVRVSDVKLGGRVLSRHRDGDGGEEEEGVSEEIEVADEEQEQEEGEDGVEQAKGVLDVWSGIGRPVFDAGEAGDRDSGIEIDRPPAHPGGG